MPVNQHVPSPKLGGTPGSAEDYRLMKCNHLGLIFALALFMPVLGVPAVAAVDATHDPSRENSSQAAIGEPEKIFDVVSHNEEARSLPLECRGYNVSPKSRRDSSARSLNRCE